MNYAIRLLLHATTDDDAGKSRRPDQDELTAMLDAVMEQLVEHDATDPSIGSDQIADTVEVSVTVQGENPVTATDEGVVLIRTAVHAAGIGTPGWTLDMAEITPAESETSGGLEWIETTARSAELADT